MSNSEPSAIVLQGIPCMRGLYTSFDSNEENGSLQVRRGSSFLDQLRQKRCNSLMWRRPGNGRETNVRAKLRQLAQVVSMLAAAAANHWLATTINSHPLPPRIVTLRPDLSVISPTGGLPPELAIFTSPEP